MMLATWAERFDALCAVLAWMAARLCYAAGVVGMLCVAGWQVFTYLQEGRWQSFSVIDLLTVLTQPSLHDWVLWPQKWIGVHKMLDAFPGSVALLIAGVFLGMIAHSAYRLASD